MRPKKTRGARRRSSAHLWKGHRAIRPALASRLAALDIEGTAMAVVFVACWAILFALAFR